MIRPGQTPTRHNLNTLNMPTQSTAFSCVKCIVQLTRIRSQANTQLHTVFTPLVVNHNQSRQCFPQLVFATERGGLSGVANPNRLQLFEIQSVYLAVVSFSLHRVYYLIYNSNPIQTRTLNVYCWRCGWDIGFVKHILKSFNNLNKD